MNITALKHSVELSIVGTCLGVASIMGTCLAVATPLFTSAKQVSCLLELDIIAVCLINLYFYYWSLSCGVLVWNVVYLCLGMKNCPKT